MVPIIAANPRAINYRLALLTGEGVSMTAWPALASPLFIHVRALPQFLIVFLIFASHNACIELPLSLSLPLAEFCHDGSETSA